MDGLPLGCSRGRGRSGDVGAYRRSGCGGGDEAGQEVGQMPGMGSRRWREDAVSAVGVEHLRGLASSLPTGQLVTAATDTPKSPLPTNRVRRQSVLHRRARHQLSEQPLHSRVNLPDQHRLIGPLKHGRDRCQDCSLTPPEAQGPVRRGGKLGRRFSGAGIARVGRLPGSEPLHQNGQPGQIRAFTLYKGVRECPV
jgi:hypothetical protein